MEEFPWEKKPESDSLRDFAEKLRPEKKHTVISILIILAVYGFVVWCFLDPGSIMPEETWNW